MPELRETEYPGYWAGDDGVIYSSRKGGKPYGKEPIPLKSNPGGTSKYLNVGLSGFGTKMVHKLICLAWHGPAPVDMSKPTVSHIDGNLLNNRPDNLLWESHSDNHERKFAHGTGDSGYQNTRASLTKEQLEDVRRRLALGEKHKDIAELYGVSRTVITRINNGVRYGRV